MWMTTVEDLRRQTVAVVIWYHPSDSNVQNIATYLDFCRPSLYLR